MDTLTACFRPLLDIVQTIKNSTLGWEEECYLVDGEDGGVSLSDN